MYANYHTHTYRCHHAHGEEREYVERAIAFGMKELGFSEHVPYPFPDGYESGYRMFREDIDNYFETLLALREEYKDKIAIRIGFEAEYYPKYFDALLEYLDPFPYEYLILGQHFLGNEHGDERFGDERFDGVYSGRVDEDGTFLHQYVDQVTAGLRTGKFTYVAHPDLMNLKDGDELYEKEMTRLCTAANEVGVPLEVNMYGQRDGRQYPCERFFRIAGKCGCRAIVGCDAHAPEVIDDAAAYGACVDLAQRCGLELIDRVTLRCPHLENK